MKNMYFPVRLLLVLLLPSLGIPREPFGIIENKPIVTAEISGGCYAKSVPSQIIGEKGTTRLYRVLKSKDSLLSTHPWYTENIYLVCTNIDGDWIGPHLVRYNNMLDSGELDNKTMVLEFYYDGKMVRKYSSSEFSKNGKNVRARHFRGSDGKSKPVYSIFKKIDGLNAPSWDPLFFNVELYDEERITFNPRTGKIVYRDKSDSGKTYKHQYVPPWQRKRVRQPKDSVKQGQN